MRLVLFIVGCLTTLGGCGLKQGPSSLTVQPADYSSTFTAAVDVLREEGLRPSLRDPRSGIIEAGPATAGSMFEPWKVGHGTFDASLESTIHHQRRRIRVEFTPRNASAGEPLDLTMSTDPIELRVQAWIERAYRPGGRRNLWSRRLSDETVVYPPGETDRPAESQFWLPVHRDADYESHLTARLADALKMRHSENMGD